MITERKKWLLFRIILLAPIVGYIIIKIINSLTQNNSSKSF